MSGTESPQRRAGSADDARGAETAGREAVFEQRAPISAGVALPERRLTGALARLLARGSQDGTEVHAAMEDIHAAVGEYVQREITPVVATIEARFDVQDAKIDVQNVKIESLTVAVRDQTAATAATNAKVEGLTATVAGLTATVASLTATVEDLTKAVAVTNAKVESLTAAVAATNAKVAAQNARIGALYWMFGIVIALFMALAAVGVYNYVLPPPDAASGTAGPARQATSGAPPEPLGEAGDDPPAPTATSREPTLDGDEP